VIEKMQKIRCSRCGGIIETIPVHCGHDMVFNEEKNVWECYMGKDCGYVPLDELFCAKCSEQC